MRIAVLTRQIDPFSLRLYRENVCRELVVLGSELHEFEEMEVVRLDAGYTWKAFASDQVDSRPQHTIYNNQSSAN